MMIDPYSYIQDKQNWDLSKLYKEKENLEKYINDYKNGNIPKKEFFINPSPNVIASMYEDYLIELIKLIDYKETSKIEVKYNVYTDYKEIESFLEKNNYFDGAELYKIYNKGGKSEIFIKDGNEQVEIYLDNVINFTMVYFTDEVYIDSISISKQDNNFILEIDDSGITIVAEKIQIRAIDKENNTYTYVSVKYKEEQDKTFYYISTIRDIKIGDIVFVPIRETFGPAIIENIEIFDYKNVPFPIERTKRIIRKATNGEIKEFNELYSRDQDKKLKVYQSESDSYVEKKVIGKYKYIGGESTTDLVKDKVYYRVEPENEFRIVDESGEDYLYIPDNFEKVE